eukprot:scaffold3248_cov24-Tisochrysis_lutea.AAC.3
MSPDSTQALPRRTQACLHESRGCPLLGGLGISLGELRHVCMCLEGIICWMFFGGFWLIAVLPVPAIACWGPSVSWLRAFDAQVLLAM